MALLDHNGEAEFPYARNEVFNAIVNAIPKISGMSVHSKDKLSGRILAKAGVSLFSWGEDIPISVVEVSHNRTKVSVTSTPKTGLMFGGAMDFGKNRQNIEDILSATSKILKNSAPVPRQTKLESGLAIERLTKLKELLDKDLITTNEFENLKNELLSEKDQPTLPEDEELSSENALEKFIQKINLIKLEDSAEDYLKHGIVLSEKLEFDDAILEFVKVIKVSTPKDKAYQTAKKQLEEMGFSEFDIRHITK